MSSLLACALLSLSVQAQITTEITAPVTVVTQGPLTFDVYFLDSVTGFDAADDVTVSLTGSAAVGGVAVNAVDMQNYTVVLSSITGNGTLQLTVPAGRATSTTTADTNLAASSVVITVDNASPVVTNGPLSRTFASTVDSSPITFDVIASGASSVDFSAADVVVSPTGTAAALVSTTTPFGKALLLDATASRSYDSLFDINVGNGLTLEAWVRPPAGEPAGFIVHYDDFAGYGMRLDNGSDPDAMKLTCQVGFTTFSTSTSPVRVGEWHHVACSLDASGDMRLYVDGVEEELFSGFAGSLTYSGAGSLSLGRNFFNPLPWSAGIDELRIWTMARTQAELAAGMTVPFGGSTTGLLGYWKFDAFEDLSVGPNAGSNDIRDMSGNALHLDTGAGAALGDSNALYGATVSLSNFAGNGSLALSLAAGIARDLAANQSIPVTISPNITVTMSATAPQIVSITPDNLGPTNADSITFRVVFSEDVTDFANDDLVITRSGVSSDAGAITPIDGSTYDVLISGIGGTGELMLGIRAGAVRNAALLLNTSAATSAAVIVDNTRPTPVLSSGATSPLDGSSFEVQINFDEVIFGFELVVPFYSDLEVSNATLSNLRGAGSSYTVTVKPTAPGEVIVGPVKVGSVRDQAGNNNSQGNALSYNYPTPDKMPPTISSVNAPAFATTAAFAIEITFSEPVVGFALADLAFSTTGTATYAGATLTQLTSSTYRIDITGAAGQGELLIEIAAGNITDIKGNANELLKITQQIDMVSPGVMSSSVSPAAAGVGQDITFQIVADEIIHTYNTNLNTVITTGDVGYLLSEVGEVTVDSTVVNITFSSEFISGNGTLALQLNPGALTDRAGHTNTNVHTTPTVIVDTILPQLLSLEPLISDRQLAPRVVSFEGVLSEPVTIGGGFTVDYEFLAVSNPDYPADLTSLVTVGAPEFITPERFRIEVDLSRVPYGADFNLWLVAQLVLRDAAGNDQAIADRRSGSPAVVDLLVTDVTISTPRTSTNQSPIPINVQFTSATLVGFPAAVTGFDLTDLNITNATASNFSGSGSDYSFDLTPTAEGEVSLWISADAARDADDRPNRSTEFFFITYDVTAPAVLAVDPKITGNPNNDASFLVYFQVSEPLDMGSVLRAVNSNLVNNGSLRSFVEDPELDVPGVEVVRIGHFGGTEGFPAVGSVDFSVPAGAVTDLAGNAATTPFALPEPITVDREPPTVSAAFTFVEGTNPISLESDSISAAEITVEFTFEEPVLDLQENDILVERDGPLGYDGTEFVSASPTSARLTLLGVAGDGVLTVSLNEGGVTDALGNGNVETGRFSVNINNIATEVVSITPASLEFDDDHTSFVVEWSKPVSEFDSARFSLIGKSGPSSPVTAESMTFTPIDTLRTRVDLAGMSGAGQFALEVLSHSAVDRFNNPNFAGLTSPLVRRIASFELGQFRVFGAETDEFGDLVGRPDLLINGVFALRGTDSSPARLRVGTGPAGAASKIFMAGSFEVVSDPAIVLIRSVGNLEASLDTETGELSFHPSLGRSVPLGGMSLDLWRARIVIPTDASGPVVGAGRTLRLSGNLFQTGGDIFADGDIVDAILVAPSRSGQAPPPIELDSASVYYPFSDCREVAFRVESSSFAATASGVVFDAREEFDLSNDDSDEPAVVKGRFELRNGPPMFTDVNVRLSQFDWQTPTGARSAPILESGEIRFPRLIRQQEGMRLEIADLQIGGAGAACGQTLATGDLIVRGRGGQTILTMVEPQFHNHQISSPKSTPIVLEDLSPAERELEAVLAPDSSYILLNGDHTLQFSGGTRMEVFRGSGYCEGYTSFERARLDEDAYRTCYAEINNALESLTPTPPVEETPASDEPPCRPTDCGCHPDYPIAEELTFRYHDLAIFHDGTLSEGTMVPFDYITETRYAEPPRAGEPLPPCIAVPGPMVLNWDDNNLPRVLEIGGQRVLDLELPFRIRSVRDALNLNMTVELPTDFQMQESATTSVPFFGAVPVRDIDKEWCGFGLPAGIPFTNFQLNPFCLTFTSPPPTWIGKATSYWPINPPPALPVIIQADIGLVNKVWDLVRLRASSFELHLSSGIYLIGIDASLHNMAQVETCVIVSYGGIIPEEEFCSVEPIEFRGQLDFAAGPDLKLVRPFGASARTKINKHRIWLNGTFWLIDPALGIEWEAGNATLTFAGPEFHMEAEAVTFPGITGTGEVNVGDLWLNGEMKVTIKVPKEVPIIGNETISEVGMGINTNPNLSIKGWFEIFKAKFAVQVTTKPELIFAKGAASLRPWESSTVYQVDSDGRMKRSADEEAPYYVVLGNFRQANKRYNAGSAGKVVSTIDIDARRTTLVRLSWANDGAVPDFTITGPGGTRFAPDTVETNPNVAAAVGYKYNAAARDATYVFSDPTPGVYSLDVGNTEVLGEYAVEVLVQNEEPTFEFVNVAATGDQLFLDWTATDGDDDAQISFFLDSDREGVNGTPIAGPFSENSDTATVVELASISVAPGSYWVYARVDDDKNAPQVFYASEPVFFVNPDAPPAVRQIEVVAAETTAFVQWGASADPDVTSYEVRWTENIEGDVYEESMSFGPDLNFAVVSGLAPNTTYKFTVVAVKAGSTLAKRRATLRDVRDAAEGRAVSNPTGLMQLGDQIERLKASMERRQPRPSANLNSYRFGQLTPSSRPLEDDTPKWVESLIAEFDIVETVALAGNNNVPEFLSDPSRTILSSGLFQYPVELRDRDGDALTLSLIEGPEGMTLDDRQLSWEPAGEEGVFAVTLEVSDGVATRTQSWNLTSAGLFADRLRIPARDLGAVEPGVPFTFRIETLGGCSSPISYRFLMAPDGMTIDGEGLVEWTPPSTIGVDYEFVVGASQVCADDVDETSRQYFVDVEAAGGDTGNFTPLPSTCAGGPTATLSGPRATLREEEVDLRVDLTGTAPWNIFWSDGEVMENIQTSPAIRTVRATRKTNYSLLAVSDANCKGTVEGVVLVGVGPDDPRSRPTRRE